MCYLSQLLAIRDRGGAKLSSPGSSCLMKWDSSCWPEMQPHPQAEGPTSKTIYVLSGTPRLPATSRLPATWGLSTGLPERPRGMPAGFPQGTCSKRGKVYTKAAAAGSL